MIQVRFEEAESRTLSETGPMSCAVFCWEGEWSLPCNSQLEGKGIVMTVRETVTCITKTGMCVLCTGGIGRKS